MRTKRLLIALPLLIFGVLAQSAFWVPTYGSQAKGNPERLRTFLRASIADAKELDPIVSADSAASDVMTNIFEGLVTADENLKLVGRLADHWDVTEEAYLAVLPDREFPDGSAITGASLLTALGAAKQAGRLGGAEASILDMELAPAEKRALSETVLVDNAKAKKAPISVNMTVDVPERVKLRLAKVEPYLFKKLEAVVGASYFENYPFADRFQLEKPELTGEVREKFPDLLAVGEHNPIITFYLRPGVHWQDGVPLTAEDVKFTYRAFIDPKNSSPRASSFEPVKSVEVVNELTARVTYKRLYAPAIIDWAMGIVPEHLLNDAALKREMDRRSLSKEARASFSLRTSEFSRKPVGSGPFRFAEWRQDQFIHLARNEDYWGEKPNYKDLYYRVIPDYLSTELEFQAGALDEYSALPHQAERYRKSPDYNVLDLNRGVYSYIGYNLRRPLFQDVRVRRALGMAVDVNSIIRYVLYGEGKRATGPFYSNTPYNDPEVKPLPYDPKGALALLAEVGWKKNAAGLLEKEGKVFQFTLVTNNGNPQRKAIMTIAQENWRKLGIDCKIQAFEWTVFLGDFVNKLAFDAIVLAWVGGDINPDKFQIWHSSQTHPFELNFVGYKSPRADELIMKIREEYDPEAQIRLTHELHRLIAEDQPYTFLYEPVEPTVLDKRIALVDHSPDGKEIFHKIAPTHSGNIDFFFNKWRKLEEAPTYAPQ